MRAPLHECSRPQSRSMWRRPHRSPGRAFDIDHPAVHAQRVIDAVIDCDTPCFGAYHISPQPRISVLSDIRAVAGRVLAYATPEDLRGLVPDDLHAAYMEAARYRIDGSGIARAESKPGLAAPARAVSAAVGVLAALSSLEVSDVAGAGDELRWLVASARNRGLRVHPTITGWGKGISPVLTGIQLAALGPMLHPSDQLRYRIGSPLPCRPAYRAVRARILLDVSRRCCGLFFRCALRSRTAASVTCAKHCRPHCSSSAVASTSTRPHVWSMHRSKAMRSPACFNFSSEIQAGRIFGPPSFASPNTSVTKIRPSTTGAERGSTTPRCCRTTSGRVSAVAQELRVRIRCEAESSGVSCSNGSVACLLGSLRSPLMTPYFEVRSPTSRGISPRTSPLNWTNMSAVFWRSAESAGNLRPGLRLPTCWMDSACPVQTRPPSTSPSCTASWRPKGSNSARQRPTWAPMSTPSGTSSINTRRPAKIHLRGRRVRGTPRLWESDGRTPALPVRRSVLQSADVVARHRRPDRGQSPGDRQPCP